MARDTDKLHGTKLSPAANPSQARPPSRQPDVVSEPETWFIPEALDHEQSALSC